MTVWIRIALYIFAGWLYGSGHIGQEVRDILTTNPEVVPAVEAAVFGIFTAIPLAWRKLALRFGWST